MALRNQEQKDQKVKHFWAMIVWNYETSRLEILEITQKGIQEAIRVLSTKKGWGSPVLTYDISIDKSGTGIETEYTVNPIPPAPSETVILDAIKNEEINLNALFYGADPFDSTWQEPTIADEVFE